MTMAVATDLRHTTDAVAASILDEGHRELELAAIVNAFNAVTEKLKGSHERMTAEVRRLRERIREKDLELERRERLAALGQMAAGVAHEVRNPLASILLCANMLSKDLCDKPESQSLADQIATAVHALDGIVGDVLAFAGPGTSRFRNVTLTAVLTDVIRLVAPRANDNRCNVSVDCRVADATIAADGAQIQRALLNLAFNAVDAAGDGDVRIVMSETDREIQMRISDSGSGVSDEIKERIFEPFFTTKDSGTGLGLAIVYRIVASHGGRIIVGDRDGGGAVFCVALPRNHETQTS